MNVGTVATAIGRFAGVLPPEKTEEKTNGGFWSAIGGKIGDAFKVAGMAVNGAQNVYKGITQADLNAATAGVLQLAAVVTAVGVGVLNPAAGLALGGFVAGNQDTVMTRGTQFLNGITAVKVDPAAVAAVAAMATQATQAAPAA
jgi:hypothetical protein